jgi:hypothetical protein
VKKIDAHIHYLGDHPDCLELFDQLELKLLNVCVAHGEEWRQRGEGWRQLAEDDRYFAWCTSFDLPDFDDSEYIERVIAQLDQDLAAGAVGCKIWKNIGMEVKKPSGEYLMADDPLFDPLYAHLQEKGVTLLAHLGEPLACWQPLNEDNPHYGYYSVHPEWHMYGKPDFPSHQEIIDARDRLLAKFPKLRVVGAHLGSLEYDVAEIARRLDQFPNLAVDTSARMRDLTYQDSEKVKQFFADYQDRILFGTDIVQRQPLSDMSPEERRKKISYFGSRYDMEMAYFESPQIVQMGDREVQGLGLSEEILEKFYRENAVCWYPGL